MALSSTWGAKYPLVSDFIERKLDSMAGKESFVNVNIFYSSLSFILTT
jgi:hypothetical protein